jgi:hypothetical protein
MMITSDRLRAPATNEQLFMLKGISAAYKGAFDGYEEFIPNIGAWYRREPDRHSRFREHKIRIARPGLHSAVELCDGELML